MKNRGCGMGKAVDLSRLVGYQQASGKTLNQQLLGEKGQFQRPVGGT